MAIDYDPHQKHFKKYPSMIKTLGQSQSHQFKLTVEAGEIYPGEIVVLLGENGNGKTTFLKLLAGILKPDSSSSFVPEWKVSYKPQKICPTFDGLFEELLYKKLRNIYQTPSFINDIVFPLNGKQLYPLKLEGYGGQRMGLIINGNCC